jgi:hypothetical protein
MLARSLIILTVIVIGAFGLSCDWLRTKNYNIDKSSPGGVYRVKVDVKVVDDGDLAGHFTDQGKIQFLKGQETITTREWNYRDNWESTFIDANPSIEWVGDNVLRMGLSNAGQPFTEELIISNVTKQNLKYLGISCGRNESFEVFDIAPGGQVVLRVSPKLNWDVSGDFSIGYGGQAQNGRSFTGALQQKQPEGPVKIQLTVNSKDVE